MFCCQGGVPGDSTQPLTENRDFRLENKAEELIKHGMDIIRDDDKRGTSNNGKC